MSAVTTTSSAVNRVTPAAWPRGGGRGAGCAGAGSRAPRPRRAPRGGAPRRRAPAAGASADDEDLRGNAGGLVEEAVATASAFLDGGPVASYESRGSRRELTAARGGDTAVPLVVMVDGGTMSAAELLAGALQDRCRAVLVGSRTFGKGTVQQPSRLADGGVLELTVGRYYTPDGRSPDGTGLQPDVAAADPAAADGLALRVLSGLGARP
ncbi:S41 family peptidase [Kitasatospora sp. NPDC059571]|uniref:S41 family peptidase n=1 Tax=Kitasatospora sp. NPDC059571 TaxID=3346871 RepID=UPI0036A80901